MLFTESLKNNFEFRRLYRRGKNESGPLLAVYCMRNGRNLNRLGITTGAKLGKAVLRNRTKRRIKEAYRGLEHRLVRGYDIVIVARTRSVAAEYAQIEKDLLARLKGLGLLGNEA